MFRFLFHRSILFIGIHFQQSFRAPSIHASIRFSSTSDIQSSSMNSSILLEFTIPADRGVIQAAPRRLPQTPAEVIAFRNNLMESFPIEKIRNVSVVAHVDHGKTTLTDAILRKAGVLASDGAVGTFTDRLTVEKERGITIKAQTCSIFVKQKRAYSKDSNLNSSSISEVTEQGMEKKGEIRNEIKADKTDEADDKDDEYLINLIDTPGHVDFQYEVSRSMRASEGAVLLVDAVQGVEAQTMAQFYSALDNELSIIPVFTKMDAVLVDAQVEKSLQILEDSTGLLRRETILTSAKRKEGLESLLQAIITRIPPPKGRQGLSDTKQLPVLHPDSDERAKLENSLVPLRALIFDSWTAESGGIQADSSKETTRKSADSRGKELELGSVHENGVYCLIRVIDGTISANMNVIFFHSRHRYEVKEVGIIHPGLYPTAALTAGMVGYVFFTDLQKKDLHVGDTICTLPTKKFVLAEDTASKGAKGEIQEMKRSASTPVLPIAGFKRVQPVVFAGFFPDEGESISLLKESVDKLSINDPSVSVENLQCEALGAGLQIGFLGLLHMQVFRDRLYAEYGQSVLITPPQVQYKYQERVSGGTSELKSITVKSWKWPHEGVIAYYEPYVTALIVTPKEYFNNINSAALVEFRSEQTDMRNMDNETVSVRYKIPLAELARGFFNCVKSNSRGYATLDYDEPTYEEADLVKVDIIINKARISALSFITPKNEAHNHSKRILNTLKANLKRSTIDLPLQALVGQKIIARETIKAYKKDVTAKIHAGDISRKQKKWADQKKGKERMSRRQVGTVTIDQQTLAAAMGAYNL